ncbi:hypothetical protein [Aliivibrio fischeri]|uniref:hypothetical protein n=1 Tax=Aliivibrio fischeri TaxID=668 RepID=UPI00137A9AFE|nr:hypothetical protein [Aliivibrio fischeri]
MIAEVVLVTTIIHRIKMLMQKRVKLLLIFGLFYENLDLASLEGIKKKIIFQWVAEQN